MSIMEIKKSGERGELMKNLSVLPARPRCSSEKDSKPFSCSRGFCWLTVALPSFTQPGPTGPNYSWENNLEREIVPYLPPPGGAVHPAVRLLPGSRRTFSPARSPESTVVMPGANSSPTRINLNSLFPSSLTT